MAVLSLKEHLVALRGVTDRHLRSRTHRELWNFTVLPIQLLGRGIRHRSRLDLLNRVLVIVILHISLLRKRGIDGLVLHLHGLLLARERGLQFNLLWEGDRTFVPISPILRFFLFILDVILAALDIGHRE